MIANEIAAWLKRKRRNGIISSALHAAATLIGGMFVLALTFSFFLVIAKVMLLSLFPLFHHSTIWSSLIASVATGLIFADSLRSRRDDMSIIPAWLLRECIAIGPRLILGGFAHAIRARRFAQIELAPCANVLAYLAGKGVPTSQRELLRNFPGLQWSVLVAQLRLIQGVIFFQPEEVRVTLTLPLRLELRRLLAQAEVGDTPEAEPELVPVDEPHLLSPSEILGVPSAASLAEIKIAYRSRIKECHPDRFASLDERSRSLAEEWTKSLNAAYEVLTMQARR